MKRNSFIKSAFILSLTVVLFTGCRISYKFTGASIPADAKTISIDYFPNRAPLVNPMLSQMLTEGLQDFFLKQVRLSMVDKGGDLAFEGEITDYNLQPIAMQEDARSAMTRLTITINVRFTNRFDAEADFERSFTQFVEFDDAVNFAAAEQELATEILELIYDQVFNASLANW